MPEQSDTLKVLTRVPSEVEASLVVLRLADYGIAATAVGGFSAEYRAEAPGSVEVMVKSTDLLAAEAALAFIQGERSSEPAADDDEDDYEDEDEVDAQAASECTEPGAERTVSRTIWIAYLLMSAAIAVVMSSWVATAAIVSVGLLVYFLSKSAPRR